MRQRQINDRIVPMSIRIDPEEHEVRELESVGNWRGKRVLEIGCGEGRLTLRLAGLGAIVEAMDPDAELVRKARKALPQDLAKNVRYKVGKAEQLAHRDGKFDAAVFAWSL